METDDADDLTSPKGGAWGSEKSAALDAFAFATAGQVLGDGMSDALIQMELLEVEGEGEASRQDSGHSVNSTFVELRPEDSWSTRMVPPGRICHICKGVFDTFSTVSVVHELCIPSGSPPSPSPAPDAHAHARTRMASLPLSNFSPALNFQPNSLHLP